MARLPKYMKQIDQTTIQVKWWGVIYLILSRVMRCLYSFFKFWGTANWYHGIDKPTFWQRIYAWRISPKTAWDLAYGIWFKS